MQENAAQSIRQKKTKFSGDACPVPPTLAKL